jgi:hypothetical protein
VVAPARPIRPADATDEESDQGWTRERRDREWPPRELIDPGDDPTGDAPVTEGDDEPHRAFPDRGDGRPDPAWEEVAAAPGPGPGAWAAMVVGPDGLRRADALAAEPVEDATELRRTAREAKANGRPGTDASVGGLAALSVVLTALRRGEDGVRAWPLGGGRSWV